MDGFNAQKGTYERAGLATPRPWSPTWREGTSLGLSQRRRERSADWSGQAGQVRSGQATLSSRTTRVEFHHRHQAGETEQILTELFIRYNTTQHYYHIITIILTTKLGRNTTFISRNRDKIIFWNWTLFFSIIINNTELEYRHRNTYINGFTLQSHINFIERNYSKGEMKFEPYHAGTNVYAITTQLKGCLGGGILHAFRCVVMAW